ncbi:LytTR family two component transcriptional regulator [Larkinella arboricola]|uniref:LytTR family two component transcriptional regulator n=1 Tax=Larkinella arboricola TaxID=643671 RepID=A0A327X8Q3_LARAB|nr:LytTR family DNA-binding domain-containing protein [Larkinella arboricola]RAK03079.1 LytTR family two component transcriptional regulator [Larkinella arboricola]
MNPYRSLIIDDELLARQVIRTLLQTVPDFMVVDEAANGTEAVLKVLQQKPDLIFLDIQMPELDGFEVMKEIWAHHQPMVVFTTAYDQYALRAFEVNAVDYLLKPFNEIRFYQALNRAKERLAQRAQPQVDALMGQLLHDEAARPDGAYLRRILVKETGKMSLVNTDDILYFDADGNYITLHTEEKNHLIYESLTNLETRLDPSTFVRIHRSHIVNLDYIAEIENHFNGEYKVRLRTGQQLKWSRSYRDNLKAFYTRVT